MRALAEALGAGVSLVSRSVGFSHHTVANWSETQEYPQLLPHVN
jgi:hypothetical protein